MIQRMMSPEELSKKLKPLFGKKIDELYFRYLTGESHEEKNEILQILMGLYQKNLSQLLDKGILIEPPEKGLVKGEYDLAKVNYAGKDIDTFGLREKDWPRHMCITGMSGSGKTTFAFNILNNFIEKKKPFLVFDWKKSFRPLMGIDKEIMTFTIGNNLVSNLFKTNINRPPEGVSPKEWINTLCDLLTESFSASFGVHKILLETLDEIFEAWGVYDGGKHYPNWEHVKKMLENKMHESKGRETGWYESAMRIASVLTFGDFGKVVSYDGKKSLKIEELFDKKVIFELNSLSNIEKKFFCEYILTYIYKLKKTKQNKINEKFEHAILVDEAHNIFLKSKTNFISESVTDMVYREMREYGTSLICLDQHISKLSDTVTGNSACHIAFQQQLPQDLQDISNIMQLRDQRELFSKLNVGTAVAKLSERHTEPFLINVPFLDLREYIISDEKVSSRMDALIQGFEIEEYDLEFKEKLTKTEIMPKKINSRIEEKKTIVIGNKENKKSEFTKTQGVLIEFALGKAREKMVLNEIERILEAGLHKKYYTKKDILIVMNEVLKTQFSDFYSLKQKKEGIKKSINVAEQQKPLSKLTRNEAEEKIAGPVVEVIEVLPESTKSTIKKINVEGLSEGEEQFLHYLLNNPNHENTTVALYKLIGLSARKGNVIKNALTKKGLIEIEEERNERGWKKLIRLSKSYLKN